MLDRILLVASVVALASVPSPAQGAGPGHRLGQANYYLVEFEKEVERQRGGEKAVWRNKKDALQRVPGVSNISVSDREYAMRVWVDPVKMDALGVSVADVDTDALRARLVENGAFIG